jgi:hypothetical protein
LGLVVSKTVGLEQKGATGIGDDMKTGKMPPGNPSKKDTMAVFQEFVSLFEDKGWLNQTLRIKVGGRRYRVSCNAQEFFAYRINDHRGTSHGHPGWPVCIVNPHQIVEDGDMSAFESTEPSADDWLRCLAEGEFENIV